MKDSTSAFRCGSLKAGNKPRQCLPKLTDIFRGLGKVVAEINFRVSQLADFVDRNLKTVVVLVDQAFDLDEVFLLKGADGIFDVVPHLGFDVAGTVAERERQVGIAGFFRLDLLGNDDKGGSDDLVFVLSAVGEKKFFHIRSARSPARTTTSFSSFSIFSR